MNHKGFLDMLLVMDIDNKKYELAKKAIFEGANPKVHEHYALKSAVRENELEFVDWLMKTHYKNINEEDKEHLEHEIKGLCEFYTLRAMFVYFRDLGFKLSPVNDKLENYYKFHKSTIDNEEKS